MHLSHGELGRWDMSKCREAWRRLKNYLIMFEVDVHQTDSDVLHIFSKRFAVGWTNSEVSDEAL